MRYKTITLELLQQHPPMYDRLLEDRILLPTLDLYTSELKDSHQMWKERLAQRMSDRSESQIASEALEFALRELEDSLACASLVDENTTPSFLDVTLAQLRHPTLPA